MNKEHIKRIHLIYGSLTGVSTVVAGTCLINACIGIYHSGDHPYSREAVAAAFAPIAVPVYLCLALIIGGFILNLVLPAEKQRLKAAKNEELLLKHLHQKSDPDKWDEQLRTAILNEQKKRRLHRLISAALVAVCSTVFLIYALNGNHYHGTEINASMISAMKLMIPCLAVPFAYIVFAAYSNKKSMQRESELLKQAKLTVVSKSSPTGQDNASLRAAGASCNTVHGSSKTSVDRRVNIVRCVFFTIGLVLMIVGIATGGVADVLAKAINICTECIGLG